MLNIRHKEVTILSATFFIPVVAVSEDDIVSQSSCSTMSGDVYAGLFAVARIVVPKDGGVSAK